MNLLLFFFFILVNNNTKIHNSQKRTLEIHESQSNNNRNEWKKIMKDKKNYRKFATQILLYLHDVRLATAKSRRKSRTKKKEINKFEISLEVRNDSSQFFLNSFSLCECEPTIIKNDNLLSRLKTIFIAMHQIGSKSDGYLLVQFNQNNTRFFFLINDSSQLESVFKLTIIFWLILFKMPLSKHFHWNTRNESYE